MNTDTPFRIIRVFTSDNRGSTLPNKLNFGKRKRGMFATLNPSTRKLHFRSFFANFQTPNLLLALSITSPSDEISTTRVCQNEYKIQFYRDC